MQGDHSMKQIFLKICFIFYVSYGIVWQMPMEQTCSSYCKILTGILPI